MIAAVKALLESPLILFMLAEAAVVTAAVLVKNRRH